MANTDKQTVLPTHNTGAHSYTHHTYSQVLYMLIKTSSVLQAASSVLLYFPKSVAWSPNIHRLTHCVHVEMSIESIR